MKKILVRTGMTPFTDTPVPEILAYDRIGSNVGNIVYAYSIYRGLMTAPDVELVPTKYLVSRLNVEEINEEFDSFVIPLADFIRQDRMKEIKAMTRLINQLKIPCHIVGIGIRADYEYEKNGICFDDDKVAYNFFKAVLNKSAMIGLRGEITAEYMKKLGFIPEKDFTVIGCPSFYSFGEELSIRDLNLTSDSKLALNNTMKTGKAVQDFLIRTRKEYKDYYYYPQYINELKTLYLGAEFFFEDNTENFPFSIRSDEYKEGRIRFHTNYLSWKKDLEGRDFSIGPRLHGNVMALHAGLPSIWIMHDARMRELADYHNLPVIRDTEIDEKTDVKDLFAKIDYKSLLKGHAERFRHYIDFLDKNEILHIYKDYKNPENAPLDRLLKDIGYTEKDFSVKSVLDCDIEEIAKRVGDYDTLYVKRRAWDLSVEEEIKKGLREERADLKKKLKAETEKHKKAKESLEKQKKTLKKEEEGHAETKESLKKVEESLVLTEKERRKVKEELSKTKEVLSKQKESLKKKENELSEAKKSLEETKEKLEKTKADLEEAKKKLTFVVRRKIGKLIRKLKGQGDKK